jgi:hypothetical protein
METERRQFHVSASSRRPAIRWARIGRAVPFGPSVDPGESAVGWMWEIRRGATEQRFVRVEITRAAFVVTDLSAEARNAIRSRGATAIDSYLHHEEPPECLFVSTDSVQPVKHPGTESQKSP